MLSENEKNERMLQFRQLLKGKSLNDSFNAHDQMVSLGEASLGTILKYLAAAKCSLSLCKNYLIYIFSLNIFITLCVNTQIGTPLPPH